ncbi:hypothetical protein TeGR_g8688 [Tetraparma gracilis]|uniref:Uncharacterized protein n=1 Tax=Tetraparma gracilis TaxID=2962635 RepID=A0ABQ6MDH2_9STRA|nr:hypothetical protein TeGR_g8688 [Tetraparma gracilis]
MNNSSSDAPPPKVGILGSSNTSRVKLTKLQPSKPLLPNADAANKASPRAKRSSTQVVTPLTRPTPAAVSPILPAGGRKEPGSYTSDSPFDRNRYRPPVHSSLELQRGVNGRMSMPSKVHAAWVGASLDFGAEGGDEEMVEVDDVTAAKMTAEAERVEERADKLQDIYEQHRLREAARVIEEDREKLVEGWVREREGGGGGGGGGRGVFFGMDDMDEGGPCSDDTTMRVEEELERMRARLLRSAAGEGDLRVISESDGEMFTKHDAGGGGAAAGGGGTSASENDSSLVRASSFRRKNDFNTLIGELQTASDIVYQGELPRSARGKANFLARSLEAGLKSGGTEVEFAFRNSMDLETDESDADVADYFVDNSR